MQGRRALVLVTVLLLAGCASPGPSPSPATSTIEPPPSINSSQTNSSETRVSTPSPPLATLANETPTNSLASATDAPTPAIPAGQPNSTNPSSNHSDDRQAEVVVERVGSLALPPRTDNASRPNGLSGSSAVWLDNQLFIIGGTLADGTLSDAIYSFDPATNQTLLRAKLPTDPNASGGGRAHGATVLLGRAIYYFGGAVRLGCVTGTAPDCEKIPSASKSIILYEPDSPVSEHNPQVAALIPDFGIWGESAVAWGGQAYLFGGTGGAGGIGSSDFGFSNRIILFDVGTQGASVVSVRLPFNVSDTAVALAGNSAFIFGGIGQNDPTNNTCPATQRYDPETGDLVQGQPAAQCSSNSVVRVNLTPVTVGTVSVVATLPNRVYHAGAGILNGTIVLVGGSTQALGVVFFDPANGTSRTGASTDMLPLLAPAVASGGGSVWVIGGLHHNDVWRVDSPLSKTVTGHLSGTLGRR